MYCHKQASAHHSQITGWIQISKFYFASQCSSQNLFKRKKFILEIEMFCIQNLRNKWDLNKLAKRMTDWFGYNSPCRLQRQFILLFHGQIVLIFLLKILSKNYIYRQQSIYLLELFFSIRSKWNEVIFKDKSSSSFLLICDV